MAILTKKIRITSLIYMPADYSRSASNTELLHDDGEPSVHRGTCTLAQLNNEMQKIFQYEA